MVRKSKAPEKPLRDRQDPGPEPATESSSVNELIGRVKQSLDEGRPDQALEAIGQAKLKSPWLSNAVAVCQIRAGNPEVAVEVLRSLVLQGGIHVRDDVPAAFKLNFAAALLGAGNLGGFLSALNEVSDDEHPSARDYRAAFQRWKASLTFREKLRTFLGGPPSRPFVLDFPPGELT